MAELIGYARASTDKQDAQAQREALLAAGVPADRIYVDAGRTVSNRERPALREALAACDTGSTLFVTKLDRLARSITDAHDIVDELTRRGMRLNIGGSLHDPTDPMGRLLFNVIAEFEGDLIRARTREGMQIAKAKGKLRGRQPKLSPKIEAYLVAEYRSGNYTVAELAQQFDVTRSTVYRAVDRAAVTEARAVDVTLPLPTAEPTGI
ncbi:recombinase family protein [Rathayibacter agropyri]|uniref:recombinase family protein n=1 Tax=Rathayibacter agropyri TaxID=1634927 RepID=UPI0015641630|nr:recombinase family protein [Rathayibacter agropyri]